MIIQRIFFSSYQPQENNGNSSKTGSTPTVKTKKFDKLRECSHFVEDGRKIANILNNSFARLGLYKSKDISSNHSFLTFEGPEFTFRRVTRIELYNVIHNLPKHKSPGPGYIPEWALSDSKLSIGTHLHFCRH